jgi:hypothetical protein
MSTSSTVDANFLEVTFRRAFLIWWAIVWRSLLWGVPAGAAVGFLEGFVGTLAGISPFAIRYVALISGLIVAIPIGIYVVRRALRQRYREFSIRLVPAR